MEWQEKNCCYLQEYIHLDYFHPTGHKKDPECLQYNTENNDLQFPRMKPSVQDSSGMSLSLSRISVSE